MSQFIHAELGEPQLAPLLWQALTDAINEFELEHPLTPTQWQGFLICHVIGQLTQRCWTLKSPAIDWQILRATEQRLQAELRIRVCDSAPTTRGNGSAYLNLNSRAAFLY